MSDSQLIARTEALCRAVAPEDLGEHTLYIVLQSTLPADLGGASVCDGYRADLGDEPSRMDDHPFWFIRQKTPPLPFINLWLADVACWENPPLSRKESA